MNDPERSTGGTSRIDGRIDGVANPIDDALAKGQANETAMLCALASAGDGGMSAAELAAATGLAGSTVRDVVRRLTEKGLISRHSPRGSIAMISAGQGTTGPPQTAPSGAPDAPNLDEVLALLPAETLRAATRLLPQPSSHATTYANRALLR